MEDKKGKVLSAQEHSSGFSFVYVYYKNNISTVQYNLHTGQTVLISTSMNISSITQDDMNYMADICKEYFDDLYTVEYDPTI
jgi:hypothetical protein